MKNFLLKITKEEKENILDKHKSLYDGYAVQQTSGNQQPLYVQDLANDKDGITVNSNGVVSSYNNKIYMKESKNICAECGLYEEVCECGMRESMCSECGGQMNEGECMECGYKEVGEFGDKFDYVEMEEDYHENESYLTDVNNTMEDESENLKESVNKTLEWFQKFKKYN